MFYSIMFANKGGSDKTVSKYKRFNVPSTAKVIQREELSLKSHPKNRSVGSNSQPLVYKVTSFTSS